MGRDVICTPFFFPLPPLTPTESPAGKEPAVRILALGDSQGAGEAVMGVEASVGSLELSIPRWDGDGGAGVTDPLGGGGAGLCSV